MTEAALIIAGVLEALAGTVGVAFLVMGLIAHVSLAAQEPMLMFLYVTGVPSLVCGVQLARRRRWAWLPSLALSLAGLLMLAKTARVEWGHLDGGELVLALALMTNALQLLMLLYGLRALRTSR